MEIIYPEKLESTGYRFLFESIKKEGLEPFYNFQKDIQEILNKGWINTEFLIKQAIYNRENDIDTLKNNHKNIMKYIEEHEKEFSSLSFTNKKVLSVLEKLESNNELLDLYIKNAKILEELKVFKISFELEFDNYLGIYRDKSGKIIHIIKYYTDGKIATSEEVLKDKMFNYSQIYFGIDSSVLKNFILRAENTSQFNQFREIYINDFSFDSSKLPTEEELEKYEIPEEITRNRILHK